MTKRSGCYCKDALQLAGVKTICGETCPLFKDCPRLILEDAADAAIDKAVEGMMRIVNRRMVNG